MRNEKDTKMAIALLFIAILAVAITYALYPYIEAFFAALIIYVIMKPAHDLLTKRLKINNRAASIVLIVLSIVIIIIPLYYLIILLSQQVGQVLEIVTVNMDIIYGYLQKINELVPALDLEQKASDLVTTIGGFVSQLVLETIQNLGNQLIGLIIMVFLLYYLFTTDDKTLKDLTSNIIPFSDSNKDKLIGEMKNIIHSTIIATFFIAAVQGGLLAFTFYLLDIQGAILWGFVTLILSIMPVVGAPLVWGPAIIFKVIEGDLFAAGVIFIAGMVISNIDNFLRPYIQDKVGAIHPFVSLLGIFIGIYLFGLVGIVVGPLVLSSFLLMLRMFYEDYIKT
ncbi:AI-2E family transporter [Methanohalophilus sp. WG1-DM]|uniref:AI-2E family transporter n=1 Tax=Methanohalophilus sp. WG1-DM TaxID=2491675 RepID=UPI000FFED68B|nr:AI-2E family transporter [Methanohalophilus sp. WG1-DM]